MSKSDPLGEGVLPYNSYTGMCHPTGLYFWDSDLKRGIIFKSFSRMGYNISNARKLQNIIGYFTVKPDVLFRATLQTSAAILVF